MKITLFVFVTLIYSMVSAQSGTSEKTPQSGTMEKKTTTNTKDTIIENVPVLEIMSGKTDDKSKKRNENSKAVPCNAAKKEEYD